MKYKQKSGCFTLKARAAANAARMTQPSMPLMMPASSAKGMNSLGGTRPRVGWFQRIRASQPVTRLVRISTWGW